MTNNINRCTISIQDIRNILKRKAIWDEPFLNEIGFSYLGHLSVGLI
jgi:hypothetical protein